jgi:hypothetical protein
MEQVGWLDSFPSYEVARGIGRRCPELAIKMGGSGARPLACPGKRLKQQRSAQREARRSDRERERRERPSVSG